MKGRNITLIPAFAQMALVAAVNNWFPASPQFAPALLQTWIGCTTTVEAATGCAQNNAIKIAAPGSAAAPKREQDLECRIVTPGPYDTPSR